MRKYHCLMMLQFFPLTIFQLNCFEICNIRSHRQSFSNPKRLVGPSPLLTPSYHVSSDLVDVILLCVPVYMFCWLLFYLVGDDGGTFWFELIPLHEPGSWLCNRSIVSFVGIDSFVQQDSVLALKSFTLKLSPLISQPPPLPPYWLIGFWLRSCFTPNLLLSFANR